MNQPAGSGADGAPGGEMHPNGKHPRPQQGQVRDLRSYARQTNFRLVVGAALLLFIVGDGLIYVIYGPQAAMLGLLCLAGALLPIGAIALVLGWMEWVVKRANRE